MIESKNYFKPGRCRMKRYDINSPIFFACPYPTFLTNPRIQASRPDLMNDGTVDYFFLKPFNFKKVCEIFRAELDAA